MSIKLIAEIEKRNEERIQEWLKAKAEKKEEKK